MKPEQDPKILPEDDKPVFFLRSAFRVITIGFLLTFFTIRLGTIFELLFPFIGTLCICFGYYRLHHVNRQFLFAYRTSLFLLFLFMVVTLLETTPYATTISYIGPLLVMLTRLFLFLFHNRGLQERFHQTIPEMRYVIRLYSIIFVMMLPSIVFPFSILTMLASFLYILLLYYFNKTRRTLESEDQPIQLTYVKRSIKRSFALICLVVLYVATLSYASFYFSVSDQNDYAPRMALQHQEERSSLIEKGLSEALVKDLHDEDVIALNELDRFVTSTNTVRYDDSVTLSISFGYANNGELHLISSYSTQNFLAKRQVLGNLNPVTIQQTKKIRDVLFYDQKDTTYVATNPKEFSSNKGENYRGYRYETLPTTSDSTTMEYYLTYYEQINPRAFPYQPWVLPQYTDTTLSSFWQNLSEPVSMLSFMEFVDPVSFETLYHKEPKPSVLPECTTSYCLQ